MCSGADQEWFRGWFNSPYYHMLYRHRDEKEAALFLDALTENLQLNKGAKILDLACGKGRHAIHLHHNGFKVTGIDLSEESIRCARETAPKEIHFSTGDMRNFELNEIFDGVFNLFTSFGYFSDTDENLQVLKQVNKHLLQGGVFVLDYFNPEMVSCSNAATGIHVCKDVQFSVSKRFEKDHIIKEIEVTHLGHVSKFVERVQLLRLPQLKEMLEKCGLIVKSVHGSYAMSDFNPATSERMIIIAAKS